MRSPKQFLRVLVATTIAIGGALYGFIVLIDPYQNVPFSPALDRAPVSTNQRFSYPAIARDSAFDSAVIGSSTMRLLEPASLDDKTGARFANLAMNSATAYEQQEIHHLFLRHHPGFRFVVIGIDDAWCVRKRAYRQFTFRAFPEWMYDDNPWNDLLYLFNDKALENSVRMTELLLGKREPKYERDGFRDFTVDFGDYDIARVQQRLYPGGKPPVIRAPDIGPSPTQGTSVYPAIELLPEILNRHADKSSVLVVFVPLHGDYLARSETLYQECKGRVFTVARDQGVRMIDFMIDSDITRDDQNYWDSLHYRRRVAAQIETAIGAFFTGKVVSTSEYLVY